MDGFKRAKEGRRDKARGSAKAGKRGGTGRKDGLYGDAKASKGAK